MRRALIALVFVVGLATLSVSPAAAIISAPEPINTPVPEKWRGPFEEFLQELKASDTKSLIEKTSAFQIGGAWQKDWILFRIEDPKTCHEDRCFTVIGRIVDNKFIANVMFSAGKHFTRGDTYIPLFGFQVMPAWLVSDTVTVTLLETPQGWTIAPVVTSKGFLDAVQRK